MITKKISNELIFGEQLQLVVDALPLSILTIFVNATILAAMQLAVISSETVAYWYVSILLVSGLRFYWRHCYLQVESAQRDTVFWSKRFYLGTVLSGLSWGAAAYFLFPVESLIHQLLLSFVLAGLTAGAVTTFSAISSYYQTFVLLALLPLAVRFFQQGDVLSQSMAAMILFYMVMVSISALRVNRIILKSLSLSLNKAHVDEALQEADDHNSLLLESAAQGIFGVDINGVATFVNPAALSILGYQAEDLIGKKIHSVIHYNHADGSQYPVNTCPMSATLRDGESHFITDEVLWSKRGCSVPVEYNSTPILKNDAVVGAVITFSDIRQRVEIESKLEHQAYFDDLTGLANRRLLLDLLEKAYAQSKHHHHIGGLLFLDLDNFKSINDSLGHKVGDELICCVAQRLASIVCEEDTLAHVGGDDFILLLPEVDDDAEVTAKVLQELACQCREVVSMPYQLQGHELHITTSVGITMFPMCGENADDLLKQADTAMYRAKEQGPSTIQFFLPSMQLAVEERMHLYNDLRRALTRDELELYYQPQYDARGEIIGAEALVRWNHPDRGLVSPVDFIPMAEDSSLILQIGEWVMQTAFAQMKFLDTDGLGQKLSCIAVNVSPRQFRQADFVPMVKKILADTGVDAHHIELELTEGILVDDIKDTVNKMEALTALGITFSIDDFGTGYSSLAYLQQLPLHKLKIDQSFVKQIQGDHYGGVLVNTIIDMGQNLGLTVIAEGVETDTQFHALSKMGCDEFQGYLFSTPVEEGVLLELLRDDARSRLCS